MSIWKQHQENQQSGYRDNGDRTPYGIPGQQEFSALVPGVFDFQPLEVNCFHGDGENQYQEDK